MGTMVSILALRLLRLEFPIKVLLEKHRSGEVTATSSYTNGPGHIVSRPMR